MPNFKSDLADFSVSYLKKLGAKYSEARLELVSSNSFILKNGIAEIAEFESCEGIGIRFIVDGCYGFVSTNNLNRESIKKLLDLSYKKVKFSLPVIVDKVELSDETANKAKIKVTPKKDAMSISPEEKLKTLTEIDKSIKSLKYNVPSSYFSLSDSQTKKYIVNSEGTKIYSSYPLINFYYFITMKVQSELVQRYWQHGNTKGWEALKNWNLDNNLKEQMKLLAKNSIEGISSPKGKIDVITGPEVTGIIAHESGGHPYEADRILGREAAQAGESFVTKDFIGKRMGSEEINVVDDSTIPNSFGYYLFDDEGVKARRKYIIKKGVINEFLNNRETSSKLNSKSNASARASGYNREAIVRMSNTFFEPGTHKFDELVKGVKKGIYLKNFNEWNIDDKRLNQKYVGCESYLIENGKITKPVKGPVIEIDTYKLYSSIDAVSKDNFELHAATCGKGEPMQGIPVLMGGPSLRIRGINLSFPK